MKVITDAPIYRLAQFALSLAVVLAGCGGSRTVSKRAQEEMQQEEMQQEEPEDAYTEVVSEDNLQASGLMDVYKHDGKYYFDMPTTLLGRDFLVLNRVLEVPPELNSLGVNKGTNYENILIRLLLDEERENLLVQEVKPMPVVPERDAIRESVLQNFRSPLMGKMDITAFSADSTRLLLDVTDYFDGSSSFFNHLFDKIEVGGMVQSDLSRIVRASSFPTNTTIVSDLSGSASSQSGEDLYMTVRVSSSFVLLPEEPMSGRILCPRVGYFTVPRSYYSDTQDMVHRDEVITRWRLEPSDTAAYLRGEPVEPVRPIVFYIDASTPKQWRSYIKAGIEAWNVAFARAGFVNAVRAMEVDSTLNKDDLTLSGINYVASDVQNAMGPSVYDPRSGEIIQADVIWWHNVLNMLRNWIVLQTGATQTGADKWILPDELLGEAMKFVACHEVGHSLGLRHNMIASSAYTVQQLRDPAFTSQNGTSASIMDYARFNYVAQPGDGVTQFSPRIGPYDLFAIEYGYRWYPTHEAEKQGLWRLLSTHRGPLYRYSEAQNLLTALDPRAQVEDLSDDPVQASTLGIANLKRILPRLLEITKMPDEPGQGYDEAGLLYNNLISQWSDYVRHPETLVGGLYLEYTTRADTDTPTYAFVPREKQKEAVDFLLKEVFDDVDWLFFAPITERTFALKGSPAGVTEMAPSLLLKNAQSSTLMALLDDQRLARMSQNEWHNGQKAYTPTDLTDRLYHFFFDKTRRGMPLSVKERMMQKNLVDILLGASAVDLSLGMDFGLVEQGHARDLSVERSIDFGGSGAERVSDALSVKRELLIRIYRTIRPLCTTGSRAMQGHYMDLKLRIEKALGLKVSA